MIKNNKGFMLIEVIVTSTIVVTTMIFLYTSFNKLHNSYKTKNGYYNLDATYATKEMNNSMLKNNDGNINEFIYKTFYEKNYGYIISNSTCTNSLTISICDNLKTLYLINNMFFLEYDKKSLNDLKNDTTANINQTFKEYIDYVIKYYDIENTKEDYSYIYLTEIKDGNNYYYANLRMR